MFIVIVSIAVFIGILFLTALISLFIVLYSIHRKNDNLKNKGLKVLIPSVIVWVLLIGVNTVLIVNYIYKNKEELKDKAVRIPAEVVGKGLAITAQSFEKNWDKGRLQQLQNLHISFSGMDYEIQKESKIYDIELIFDNTSPTEVKLYLDDLIGNHYLMVCDKDDFVYTISLGAYKTVTTQINEKTNNSETSRKEVESTYYANTIIPFGKSKYRFNVTVSNDVDITYARFVNTVIPFDY
jgi:hypothetical protein